MGLFGASEIDTDEVARRYRALLVDGEEVLIAFRTIRDIAFLTDRRLAMVNIQGWIGKKVAIQSIPLSFDRPLFPRDRGHLQPRGRHGLLAGGHARAARDQDRPR